jgi:5-methylcytosine-specific restriction endonuclease McrA
MNPYLTAQWRTFRGVFLRSNPYCVCSVSARTHHHTNPCGAKATTVDHITPARAGNVTHFAALCTSCHSFKTATYDGGFGNGARA